MTLTDESTEVVIVGCGPTGALLSALLSQLNVRNICLEKESTIATDPRGIALDEDGIRALQAAGILDQLYSTIGRCMGHFNFVGGVHSDLHHPPFMAMDYGTSEGGTGHVGFICHKQPALEASLRTRIHMQDSSKLRESCTVTAISEDEERVTVNYQDAVGSERTLSAKFLVGADGKTGFTRKRYLEPKGILMEQISDIGEYAETWVAMNLKLTLPTPQTNPDFPLWCKGYSPEQVFDLFFPPNFRFLCNPERPAVCGRFGLPEDRLWRFEYVVQEGEDGKIMASPANVKRIVFPYLRHPGKSFGLSEDVSYPEDCIEILRSRPFFFSARSCNQWALGRVALCGDSAHVFPPYGGQGIASGFRDAMALAWRLKVACHQLPQAHDRLLSGWYRERKQQLEQSLAATVENGRYVTERNPFRIFLRDAYLSLVQLVPSWKRWLEQGARKAGLCRYTYQDGLHFSKEFHGGGLFPQVYCFVPSPISQIRFSDDIIFSPEKQGLFQLVIALNNISSIQSVVLEVQRLGIDSLSNGFVRSSELTIVVEEVEADVKSQKDITLVRVASAAEFAQSPLCRDRPEPLYYDEHRISEETSGRPWIILRPDRFIFAACSDSEQLRKALQSIEPVLKGHIGNG